MVLLLALVGAAFVGRSDDDNYCTYNQGSKMKMYRNMLASCGYSMGCTDEEGEQNRRRLQEEDADLVTRYACYCQHCSEYMEKLQDACNACDAANYCEMECDDDGNCACEEEEEMNFFSQNCMIDEKVVMPHADSFCNMMSSTNTDCLMEMQYMIRPPEEEEDDDNNNNGRRLLDNNNDEEEEQWEMQPEQMLACWAAPFVGSDNNDNFYSMEYCRQLCDMYGQQSFDYMSGDVPVQTCGFAVSYLDDTDESLTSLLPHPTRNQGVMCISSTCSNTDVAAISDYLVSMASYSQFINFEGEEGGGNNNNKNNQDENFIINTNFTVFETMGKWKCDGDGAEGEIENSNFPDECAQEEEDKEEDESEEITSGGHGLILATAIVFAIGFIVFFLLFLYYYRQAVQLKTGALLTDKGNAYGSEKATANAQVGV